ncbi:MAG: hypothetical protein CEN88_421 [Candidatus Berkelbacteria bacterium Licking1014_2]|uniref:F5/8 type C domain-containing protein n=1 Tax=Candidatus Berkelbacteria bacterium Licking1014_2 TaxID=2017146 RepID=A0A554LSI4_9BACT|nr:MAG: hypothetical protein CEN88_421 [Candidatus Berkelbacteria bacterium Licking1014_2]
MFTTSSHYLRDKYRWYHLWHTHPHHSKIHWGLLVVYCLAIVLVVDIILFTPNIVKLPKSADQSKSITTQSDWQAGTYDSGIDLTTAPGSIEVKPSSTVDLSTKTISASMYDSSKEYLRDGNTGTSWGGCCGRDSFYWQVNLDQETTISKVRTYAAKADAQFQIESSDNETDWTVRTPNYGPDSDWHEFVSFWPGDISSFDAKYIRLVKRYGGTLMSGGICGELELYSSPMSATHTSAFGQIGVTGETGRYVADFLNFTASRRLDGLC